MGSFYYLMAAVPTLRWDGTPPISHGNFLEQCRMWLGPGEIERLEAVTLAVEGPPAEPPWSGVTSTWQAFEHSLRNRLARIRARSLGRPEAEHQRTPAADFYDVANQVEEALEAGNPLEVEKALLKIRWDFLEGLTSGHAFDFEALVIYSLKLQLLERRQSFDPEAGRTFLEDLLERSFRLLEAQDREG